MKTEVRNNRVDFDRIYVYNINMEEGVHMCDKNKLHKLLHDVTENSKKIFKNNLESIILYGSYARGDYDDESDIDIMILVNLPKDKLSLFNSKLDELCGTLLFNYGVVVSIVQTDVETYYRYVDILPFYQNVSREGVKIA